MGRKIGSKNKVKKKIDPKINISNYTANDINNNINNDNNSDEDINTNILIQSLDLNNITSQNNDIINNKINDIMMDIEKKYEKKLNDAIKKERIDTLNRIFDLLPHLENQRDSITSNCLLNDATCNLNASDDKNNEIILDEFEYKMNDTDPPVILYKDKMNRVYNQSADLIGTITESDDINSPISISFITD